MTAISTTLDRRLAQAVAITDRWKRTHVSTQKAFSALDFLTRAAFYVRRNHRYLTAAKLSNMGMVNLQFLLKSERVLGRPYKMKIESTNICNTSCQLCPTGMGLEGRDKGRMRYEQFTQLVDKFAWHLMALDLSMWGDPLIVPDIYDMIRYAHNKRIWTYISSNLHAYKLNPKLKEGEKHQAERLVESGLDLMTCSLHGASQDTYQAYQPGKNLDDAVAKIRQIVETRDRLGSRTPQLQLNFVVMKQNEHEKEAFERLAADLGCKAVFSSPSVNARFVKDRMVNRYPGKKKPALVQINLADDVAKQQTRKHLERWLPSDESHRLDAYDRMLADEESAADYNGHKELPCDWPWRQAVINWDGGVSMCCGSWGEGEDVGNVFETSFEKIWNSQTVRMARRSFKQPIPKDEVEGNPCASCPGCML